MHDAQKVSRDNVKRGLANFLRENMDSATLAYETNRLESENENLRLVVEQARLQLARVRDTKKEWQDKLERRRRELTLAKDRMAKATVYDDELVAPTCASLELAAQNSEEIVASERRKKMEQLIDILPLVVAEPGIFGASTIAGIPLGETQTLDGSDPQTLLALTLLGRMVILASYYLRIQLPYQLIYDKGEAWIEQRGVLVHLHRGLANFRFNIKFLCVTQGVPANVLARVDLIESIWQLFHSPSLGRPIREAMLQSELRENKLVLRKANDPERPLRAAEQPRTKSRKAKKREDDDDFVLVG